MCHFKAIILRLVVSFSELSSGCLCWSFRAFFLFLILYFLSIIFYHFLLFLFLFYFPLVVVKRVFYRCRRFSLLISILSIFPSIIFSLAAIIDLYFPFLIISLIIFLFLIPVLFLFSTFYLLWRIVGNVPLTSPPRRRKFW